MATIKFNLRNKKPNKPQSICIVFRHRQARIYLSTGLKILPKYWNDEKQEVRKVTDVPNRDIINSILLKMRKEVDELTTRQLYENKEIDLESVKSLLNELTGKKSRPKYKDGTDFFQYIDDFIRASGSRINPNTGKPIDDDTIRKYRRTYELLKAFAKEYKRQISFENIDMKFYAAFVEWLQFRGDATNTIGKRIRTLKIFLNTATHEGINTNLKFKSRDFKVISEQTDSVYLSESELEQMQNLDLSSNARLRRVRDLFLIGAWTGLRFSDFTNIQPENIKTDTIEIRQQKTGELVIIPILPPLRIILNEYGNRTPEAISNQKTNEYIKDVAQLADIKELVQKRITKGGKTVVKSYEKWELITSHTARRSFASNLYRRQIVPTKSIMKITGHKTESAFMKYIRLSDDEHANIIRMAWEKPTEKPTNSLRAVK